MASFYISIHDEGHWSMNDIIQIISSANRWWLSMKFGSRKISREISVYLPEISESNNQIFMRDSAMVSTPHLTHVRWLFLEQSVTSITFSIANIIKVGWMPILNESVVRSFMICRNGIILLTQFLQTSLNAKKCLIDQNHIHIPSFLKTWNSAH